MLLLAVRHVSHPYFYLSSLAGLGLVIVMACLSLLGEVLLLTWVGVEVGVVPVALVTVVLVMVFVCVP